MSKITISERAWSAACLFTEKDMDLAVGSRKPVGFVWVMLLDEKPYLYATDGKIMAFVWDVDGENYPETPTAVSRDDLGHVAIVDGGELFNIWNVIKLVSERKPHLASEPIAFNPQFAGVCSRAGELQCGSKDVHFSFGGKLEPIAIFFGSHSFAAIMPMKVDLDQEAPIPKWLISKIPGDPAKAA